MRPNDGLCNLTEVVVRADDTPETLKEKVRLATILGTMQATLTDFHFVGESWTRNAKEEALLGVSMTGIMDNQLTSGKKGHEVLAEVLEELRDYTFEVNAEWADKLGIRRAAAVTTNKPSGTVSQLTNSASGIHARHSQYYLRTVRMDKKDPLYQFMMSKGIYCEDDVMKPDTGAVFYFPIKAPEGSVVTTDRCAVEQLELWLLYQRHWTHHKPSVTINVEDGEWMEVGAWVWKHFDEVSGVSFLPGSGGHSYRQAPYQTVTKEEYDEWVAKHPMPAIDWSELSEFEKEDTTVGMQTLSCTAGVCEIA